MPSSLLALLDDIASTLDDVAAMTKVAAKKTAGVLGDDLALNAQQVSGVSADRELPIVWAVAKGSFVNKVILIPAALLISVVAPWAIKPFLMLGGAYLCFEGVEKIVHSLAHPSRTTDEQSREAVHPTRGDRVPRHGGHTRSNQASRAEAEAPRRSSTEHSARSNNDSIRDGSPPAIGQNFGGDAIGALERERVRGAIRTDFVLSAEIIVISLASTGQVGLGLRAMTLVAVGLVMTIGVYGLVALIVKVDDFGEHLSRSGRTPHAAVGRWLLRAAPIAMRGISVVGTMAMFLVGGSLIVHGWPSLHDGIMQLAAQSGWLHWLITSVLEIAVAILAGGAILLVTSAARRLRRSNAP